MSNSSTAGVGLLSRRVKKTPSYQVSDERYSWLKLEETEPDLGVSVVNGSLLTTNQNGERTWTTTIFVDDTGNLKLSSNLQVSNVLLTSNTITTVDKNSNLYITPNGIGSVHFQNDVKHYGTIYANNGNLSSSNIGFNLLNTTVQTINFGGAASNINIGYGDTDVLIPGNLTVIGEYTYNTPQISVIEDYILVLGESPTPTDLTANGGGIELKGTTIKSIKWYDATDAWTISENFDLLPGKTYKINGSTVLSSATLGNSVVNSSLTSVGIITQGTWRGSEIGPQFGGTGLTNYSTGDIIYANGSNTLNNLNIGPIGSVLVSDGSKPVWDNSLSLIGNLTTTGTVSINNLTVSTSNITGALTVQGGVGVGGALYAGSLQSTPIGNVYRSTGAFTLLTANNLVSFTRNQSSTSANSGTLVVTGGVGISENLNVGNNLTAGGSVSFGDSALTIGGLVNPTFNNGKDKGIEFRWHDTIDPKIGFFGFSNSTKKLIFIPEATNTGEVFSGTKGEIDALVDWSNIQNVPPAFEDGGYDTVIITDTDSGFTWTETGTLVSTTSNSLTFVSGAGIDIDADATNNAVKINHADTSSVANLTPLTRTYVSGLTFDTHGHVLTYSTATEVDVTNITDITTNNVFYPVFSSISNGVAPNLSVTSSKFTFNPSLGLLTTTDLNTTSDITLKENISNISSPIETIQQLNGIQFNWKDTGLKSYGVIAQEIEKILPELVHESDDGIKHVSYIPLIAFLIEAIKDLQVQVNCLKSSK